MNKILHGLIGIVLMTQSPAVAVDALPPSVQSWEGEFLLEDESLAIRFHGLPTVYLWKYTMEGEEKGTPLAFTHEDGSVLWVGVPNERGVQPVYLRHIVSINDDGSAEIFVTYSVQGNGAMMIVERYAYDGKQLVLRSTSMNNGKPEFEWRRLETEQHSNAARPDSLVRDTIDLAVCERPFYRGNRRNEEPRANSMDDR